MNTNGAVHAQDHVELSVMPQLKAGPRDLATVIKAMIAEVPEDDDFAQMLHGVLGLMKVIGCRETESICWQNAVSATMNRLQMFGRQPAPEWFMKACAIFRGEA